MQCVYGFGVGIGCRVKVKFYSDRNTLYVMWGNNKSSNPLCLQGLHRFRDDCVLLQCDCQGRWPQTQTSCNGDCVWLGQEVNFFEGLCHRSAHIRMVEEFKEFCEC